MGSNGVRDLGDFTTPPRPADFRARRGDWRFRRLRRRRAAEANQLFHRPLLLPAVLHDAAVPGGPSPGRARSASLPHPVVAYDARGPDTFMGMIGLNDLLTARARILDA